MSDTTQRILRLLGLLQSRSVWTGPELAARLAVSERTVRRDVASIRELGYRVDGAHGVDGGYRITGGTMLPPLLLDDDEAVALIACLRMGALDGADAVGEAALRAVAKLDAVLPKRIRAGVAAVNRAVVALPSDEPPPSWQMLLDLATAQRDRRLVRFTYQRADGTVAERTVEPERLITRGRRWYLHGLDRDRDDWRLFRFDRIVDLHVLTFTFQPRPAPEVEGRMHDEGVPRSWPCEAVVRFSCGSDAVTARIPERYAEVVDADADGCTVRVGSSSWSSLAMHLMWAADDMDATMQVVESDDMRDALAQWARAFEVASGANAEVKASQ